MLNRFFLQRSSPCLPLLHLRFFYIGRDKSASAVYFTAHYEVLISQEPTPGTASSVFLKDRSRLVCNPTDLLLSRPAPVNLLLLLFLKSLYYKEPNVPRHIPHVGLRSCLLRARAHQMGSSCAHYSLRASMGAIS